MSNCKHCKFFQDSEKPDTSAKGVCCFSPPTVVAFMTARQGIQGPEPAPIVLTTRPNVARNDVACKEFIPALTN